MKHQFFTRVTSHGKKINTALNVQDEDDVFQFSNENIIGTDRKEAIEINVN